MSQLIFNPPVIAHRGASAYAPENTLVAFTKAAQLGIKWIEFDVMPAACEKPIIFHDDLLERTTNGKGDVQSYSYDYLATLDAGRWFDARFSGEKIPCLQAVLEFLQVSGLNANVEIKGLADDEEKLVVRVLKEMQDFLAHTSSTILFSSFSIETLYLLRAHAPDCLLGLLLHEYNPDWKQLCESLRCVSVHVNNEIITQDFVQEIKGIGRNVLSYTVNEAARAMELYSWGVDAVFSDVPDKIAKAVSARNLF